MWWRLVLGLALVSAEVRELTKKDYDNIKIKMKKIGYDKRVRPGNTKILDVRVDFFVIAISHVSHSEMNYDISFLFRQHWRDERLANLLEKNRKNETIAMDSSAAKQLWIPDLIFKNEETARRHSTFNSQKAFQVSPAGDITYSEHLSMSLRCIFHLKLFPFDTQACPMTVQPYQFRDDQIRLRWANMEHHDGEMEDHVDVPIQLDSNIEVPGWAVHTMIDPSCDYELYGVGKYSCVKGYIEFRRKFLNYLFTIYLPSSLCVVVSWITFWLNLQVAPARIALGVTTLLNIVQMNYNLNRNFPAVSYMKAVDYWNCACFLFVVFSLAEFGLATYMMRGEMKSNAILQKVLKVHGMKNWTSVHPKLIKLQEEKKQVLATQILLIDENCRYCFPLAFLIFNTMYWATVFIAMNVGDHDHDIISVKQHFEAINY